MFQIANVKGMYNSLRVGERALPAINMACWDV